VSDPRGGFVGECSGGAATSVTATAAETTAEATTTTQLTPKHQRGNETVNFEQW